MPVYPLCEVFGFPSDNMTTEAKRHRENKLCPFNNRVETCTKDSVSDPLGVCSTWINDRPVIICPVRFRQNWQVVKDTSDFLLPTSSNREFVGEVKLVDGSGNPVGNIDGVLVDATDVIRDFGAIEIQAVYISGNIYNPFRYYIDAPEDRFLEIWNGRNKPRPDWLSSIKRLIRQIEVKGDILIKSWGKKIAIASEAQFFEKIPLLRDVEIG